MNVCMLVLTKVMSGRISIYDLCNHQMRYLKHFTKAGAVDNGFYDFLELFPLNRRTIVASSTRVGRYERLHFWSF